MSRVTPRGVGTTEGDVPAIPLCAKRRRELLVDCDGALHFCFNQELERPVANLHALDDEALRALLCGHVPAEPWRACATCTRYQPEGSAPQG